MAKLMWDQAGNRFYETGTDRGVLAVYANKALGSPVAWNGLTAVTESPSGAEANPIYADNLKYLNILSAEEFGATIECYTYPDEFLACDGIVEGPTGGYITAQTRAKFAFAFRTKIGNDEMDAGSSSADYKLHLVYNCLAAPSEKSNATINDSPEALTFSYEVSTTPEVFELGGTEYKTAHLIFDTRKHNVAALEDAIYGTAEKEPKFPTPTEALGLVTKKV